MALWTTAPPNFHIDDFRSPPHQSGRGATGVPRRYPICFRRLFLKGPSPLPPHEKLIWGIDDAPPPLIPKNDNRTLDGIQYRSLNRISKARGTTRAKFARELFQSYQRSRFKRRDCPDVQMLFRKHSKAAWATRRAFALSRVRMLSAIATWASAGAQDRSCHSPSRSDKKEASSGIITCSNTGAVEPVAGVPPKALVKDLIAALE